MMTQLSRSPMRRALSTSYHVIERHAKLVRVLGRMAVFHPSRRDQSALHEAINQYSEDWL
jgi:hypothetical protein